MKPFSALIVYNNAVRDSRRQGARAYLNWITNYPVVKKAKPLGYVLGALVAVLILGYVGGQDVEAKRQEREWRR